MSENKTEEQLNIEDLEEEDVRILTYEDDGLPDLDMEIDLSDIFDEGPESGFDDEVLKLFKHGEDDKKVSEGNVSSKTMVADRASIKEEVLEENSIEKQKERALEDEEPEYEDIGREKKRHRRSYFFLKAFLLLVAAGVTIAFALSPVFTIKNIEVEGNGFYTDKQIINMSEAKTGGNLFKDAQKSLIKKTLLSKNTKNLFEVSQKMLPRKYPTKIIQNFVNLQKELLNFLQKSVQLSVNFRLKTLISASPLI